MKTRWFASGLPVVIACVIVAMLLNRKPAPTIEPQPAPVVPVAKAAPAPPLAPEESLAPAVEVKKAVVQSTPKPQPALQKPAEEPLHDPDARDALALVGVDPEAELYWLDAIYDTSLPDSEREDLMEDLNEVGFADPKNLTADDLPLIASRLLIIEEILPNADDFMRAHLLEAGKDLSTMADNAP